MNTKENIYFKPLQLQYPFILLIRIGQYDHFTLSILIV